jgi:hypothetical protein
MTWDFTRERITVVTELAEVARKPMIKRLAWGPNSTACDRTGLNSVAADAAQHNASAKTVASEFPPSGFFIYLMGLKRNNSDTVEMRTTTPNFSQIMPMGTPG